jgi:TP901 family phage tail tape measure protein
MKNISAGMEKGAETTDTLAAKMQKQSQIVDAEKSKLNALKSQLQRLVQAQESGAGVVADLTNKYRQAAEQYGENSAEAKKYLQELNKAETAQDKNAAAIERLNVQIVNQDTAVKNAAAQVDSYANALSSMNGDAAQAQSGAEDLSSSFDDVNDSAEDTTGGGLTAFGVALANLAADIIASAINKMKELITETVKVGETFDSSMSNVGAISGATADEMDALRDKAAEMGASTKFSASEVADGFGYMAMAGWKTEQMVDGIDGVLNLAAASGADLATTSDIVTDALTAMGLQAGDAAHLADVMAAASSNANTNVEMMGETFKYVAPVAGSLGYSIEDTATAIGLMANAGIKSSQAGTALRGALTRITKPSKEAQEAMLKLGLATETTTKAIDSKKLEAAQNKVNDKTLSLEKSQIAYNTALNKYGAESTQAQTAAINLQKAQNALAQAQEEVKREQEGTITTTQLNSKLITDEQGNMRDLSDVMSILRDSFKDLSADEKAQAASSLFGQNAMSGMLAIINASDEDFNKLSSAIQNADGKAAEMAETMQDNLGGDVTKAKSNLESFQLMLYRKFEPTLRNGVNALNKLIDKFKWLIENSDTVKKKIEKIAPVIAGIGTAIATFLVIINKSAIIGAFVTGLTAIKTAFVGLWAVLAANPIGLIIAAVAGLVAAIVTLWNTNEDFRNWVIGAWETIKNAVETAITAITEFFQSAWDGTELVKEEFSQAWEDIKSVWSTAGDFFAGIWTTIKVTFASVGTWFKTKFTSAWTSIKNVFSPETVGEFFGGIWDTIKSKFTSIGTKVGDAIGGAFKSAINAVLQTVEDAINAVPDAINGALDVINQIPGVNIPSMGYVELPRLAKGGIVGKSMLANIGEAGKEAVIPLERNKAGLREIARLLVDEMPAIGGVNGAKGGTVYNFTQNNTSPKALSRYEIYRQTKNLINAAKGAK